MQKCQLGKKKRSHPVLMVWLGQTQSPCQLIHTHGSCLHELNTLNVLNWITSSEVCGCYLNSGSLWSAIKIYHLQTHAFNRCSYLFNAIYGYIVYFKKPHPPEFDWISICMNSTMSLIRRDKRARVSQASLTQYHMMIIWPITWEEVRSPPAASHQWVTVQNGILTNCTG